MSGFADLREDAAFWRKFTAVLAVAALALLVAALVRRPPPDFSALRIVAVLRDGTQRPLWAIRLAPSAHQIAADSRQPLPPPPGHVYELWLAVKGSTDLAPLGLLPAAGREVIPVAPENAGRLLEAGQLVVTLEPAGGSPQSGPTGPVLFRAGFDGRDKK